jgi:hypothetical protein
MVIQKESKEGKFQWKSGKLSAEENSSSSTSLFHSFTFSDTDEISKSISLLGYLQAIMSRNHCESSNSFLHVSNNVISFSACRTKELLFHIQYFTSRFPFTSKATSNAFLYFLCLCKILPRNNCNSNVSVQNLPQPYLMNQSFIYHERLLSPELLEEEEQTTSRLLILR